MKVKEIADYSFPKIGKDQRIKEALRLMNKERVDRLIVVKGKQLFGIITEFNVFCKLSLRPTNKFIPYNFRVSGCATTNVETISEDANVRLSTNIFIWGDLVVYL